MKTYISKSSEDTKNLAKKLTGELKGVIALTGELGAGKTTFVQGFAEGLKIKDKIISPTFILIRQHQIPHTSNILYHLDLYRLNEIKDIRQLGINELAENPGNIVLIEWAEKGKSLLPKETSWIKFETINESKRRITISS